jgi:hypothetical protein
MTFLEQINQQFEEAIAQGPEANLKFQAMLKFQSAFKNNGKPELIKYLGHLKIAVNEPFMQDPMADKIIGSFARMMISYYDFVTTQFGDNAHDVFLGMVQNDMMFSMNLPEE